MAYPNGYFPTFYQPQVQMPMQMPMQMQQPVQQPMQQPQPQIQDGGFMLIPNEDIVNTYPVAPGKCVTFKIEGKPIVMEKSMGFSQLESPKIERYRLVKEEPQMTQSDTIQDESIKLPQKDYDGEIKQIWDQIEAIKKELVKSVPIKKKKEVTEDDADA